MSRVKDFVEKLHDVELSFLYKYKYPGFFDQSQAIVRAEIENRGLTQDVMNAHIEKYEYSENNTGCPRCNSILHTAQQVEYTNTSRYQAIDALEGRDSYTTVEECSVCGYKLFDGNSDSSTLTFFQALKIVVKRMFKKK